MSRLIVKNLPGYLSDARLKEHFGQKGLVTDVKLMTRPDGTSRRFGFVGYRTEQEAKEALDYFNRTFIDTSRIQVDFAKKIGDQGLAAEAEKRRVNKRAAQNGDATVVEVAPGPAAAVDQGRKKKKKTDAEKSASKAKGVSFEEFMAVMAPKKKRKTWQNEEDDPEERLKAAMVAPDQDADAASKPKAKKVKRQTGSEADKEAAASIAEIAAPERDVTPDEAINDEGLTDMEYMARRMRRNVGVEAEKLAEKQFEQSDSEAESEAEDEEDDADSEDEDTVKRLEQERLALEAKAKKDQEDVDTIMSSGRLFVRNLPFAATEDDLSKHFAAFGTLKQAHIPLDKASKTSKGLAFVTFEDPAHALASFRAADGSTFQGRLLHLLPAVDLRPRPDAPKTIKQSKAEERKAKADKDFNWSMLYMSADAVASSVSERLGVTKSDILNPSDSSGGDSAAVRLALAETRVIQETKEFLEKEGINLNAFEDSRGKKERSDTTILVKNIPYGTSPDTIREVFEKHGEVDRVLVPPTGTLALVEMAVPGEARVAFKALAYRRIGNSILYLEKAPVGVVSGSASKRQADAAGRTSSSKAPVAAPPSKREMLLGSGSGSEADAEAGATLFVKNLSFATTDARLAELFGTLADFAFARVQTRVDGRDPTKRLSMGYGFVGYRSVQAAQTALTTLNGKDLDGHSLSLSFARRGADGETGGEAGKGKGKTSTKLIVKNLPFEATKKDVRALFSSYGQLKSVRVPRKAPSAAGTSTTGSAARGFAFVEFTTKKEAEGAFEALRHTHLLGRHLVLQWDHEDGRGVEGVREKVKESFQAAQAMSGGGAARAKKQKLKLGEEDIAEASRKEREKRMDEEDD